MGTERKRRILFTGEASFLSTGFGNYYYEVLKRLHATGEFELAELGSYAHDDDPRCQQVPWKFYPVAPARSDQQAMQKYMPHPGHENQFGKGRFGDTCLDWKPDIVIDHRDFWMCFDGETPIIMADGSVNAIRDIIVQDRVLTHKGNGRRVLECFKRQYDGNLYTIKAGNLTIPITVTSEHPLLVMPRHRDRFLNKNWNLHEPEWKKVEDITKNDFLCLPLPKNVIDDTNCSVDLCRLIGYYLAQGCLLYEGKRENNKIKGIQLTFNYKLTEYAEDIRQLIKTHFSLNATIHKRGNCNVIRAYGNEIGEFFLANCGEYARNKIIAPSLYRLPNTKIAAILCGLTRGDGCLSDTRGSYNTVSRNLAYQVFMMFCRLGVIPSMSYNKNPTGKGPGDHYRYIMGIRSKSLDGFRKIYNECKTPASRDTTRSSDNYVFLTIKDITITNVKLHDVYNFEVEGDNSYVTSVASHNCEFIDRSSIRPNFTFCAMPTVDGEPQRELWLDMYNKCDGILTYSEYGMDLLKRTGRPKTNLITMASPGVDLDVFKPPVNKRDHKAKLGIDPNSLIIGTVMRNQKRKLYYDLIETFSMWLQKSKSKGHLELAKRTFLYLHTSYPDVGYDIGKAIRDFNVGNKVIMTYLCGNCQAVYPSFFTGAVAICRQCGKLAAHPPNASHSCPRNVLADIMKTFDLYVQYSIAEGYGMPCVDAISCGVPVAAVDYSAMQDHLQCPTSIPIKVGRFFWEAIIETEQRRALPDNQDFVNKLDRFLKQSEDQREERSKQTRDYAEELVDTYGQSHPMPRYSWDRTAAIWAQVLREIPIKDPKTTWLCPTSRIHNPSLTPPSNDMSNSEFVNWVIGKIWNRPDMLRTHFANDWLQCLNSGSRTMGDKRIPFTRKDLVEHFMEMVHQGNFIEEKRIALLNAHNTPDQIRVTVI